FENGVSFSRARLITRAVLAAALRSPPISAPAENAFSPAPVSTTQRQSASASSRSHNTARSARIARVMALRRGSLAIVTSTMCGCGVSTRISMRVLQNSSPLRGPAHFRCADRQAQALLAPKGDDEAISLWGVTVGARLLRFARNDNWGPDR